jgi:hypothetical protein
MLQITSGRNSQNCQGQSRRTAMKAGFLGCLGLSLSDLLRLQAEGKAGKNGKSVILMWLDGGPSQLETYDPKPEAPPEYRGPFETLQTNVPGMHVSGTLPLHAKHADKMAFIRSIHHDNGDHFAAGHWMLTGRYGSTSVNKDPMFPSVGSYVARINGANQKGMPPYVGLPAAHAIYVYPGYQGSAYLGSAWNPFQVNMQQKYLPATYTAAIQPPAVLKSIQQSDAERSASRLSLLGNLDGIRRDIDQSGMMDSMDRYQQQAVDMVSSGQAREALNIEKEDPRLRDRYGRGPWGHYTLMARRMVEAGVSFVTVDMPHWDNHSGIEKGHGSKLEKVDQAVSALLEDLALRGMQDDVLLVVMGEFGRTPRMNKGQPGIPVPGRDHWGNAISAMVAGGGLRGGVVVGATNSKAEHPIERALKPRHLLATIYKVLDIDPEQSFLDHSGRPVPVLAEGEPISELF